MLVAASRACIKRTAAIEPFGMTQSPESQLEQHRARIDALDDQLIALLKERIGIVKQVAKLKAENWPSQCHIRSGREGRMHARIAREFQGSDFPPSVALAIWRQIIGASTHVESPLTVAVVSDAQAAMAREYFGVSAHIKKFPSIAEALADKGCTILLAEQSDLPVVRAVSPALKIFGALPLQNPTVLALAKLTPETSGDDISYYLINGRIETRDGFEANDQWLGAHPRPVTL